MVAAVIGMVCPHCGASILKRRRNVKLDIIGAIKLHGPVRVSELCKLVYDEPYASSEQAPQNIRVQISQINRSGRVLVHMGVGMHSDGYVYVGKDDVR